MKESNLREKQKQQSHSKIIKAALALFGKQGVQATGIDQIMKKAGLTAGAFYGHFKSKDQLIEEVLWSALPVHKHVGVEQFLDHYLTQAHRDHPEVGCPLASLGSDMARTERKLKARIAKRLDEVIMEKVNRNPSPGARRKALLTLSTAVGALILSRMTGDSELSSEFLSCYR